MERISDVHGLIDKGQPDVALAMLWGDYEEALAAKRMDWLSEIAAAAQRVRSSPAASDEVKAGAQSLLEQIASGRSAPLPPPAPPPPVGAPASPRTGDVSALGIGLVLAGAAATIIAVFLPRVESTTFFRVAKNSLIQQGDGWVFVVIALAALGSLYRIYRSGKGGWGPIIAGAAVIGLAIYYGTNKDQLTLCPVNPPQGIDIGCQQADPGVGLYVAGVGGLLVLAGGIQLLRYERQPEVPQAQPGQVAQRSMKRCPDCAEDVLVEARVCRYCGHEFTAAEQPLP